MLYERMYVSMCETKQTDKKDDVVADNVKEKKEDSARIERESESESIIFDASPYTYVYAAKSELKEHTHAFPLPLRSLLTCPHAYVRT